MIRRLLDRVADWVAPYGALVWIGQVTAGWVDGRCALRTCTIHGAHA